MNQEELQKPDDYISPEEREHLLNGLHRYLIWVGERVPEEVLVNGEYIKLHELVWRCVHKNDLSDDEKNNILGLVENLEIKTKLDEEILSRESLTREEAKRLYNEIASFIRAIMDLKECEAGRIKLMGESNEIRQKVNDARRWIVFLKNVSKKSPI